MKDVEKRVAALEAENADLKGRLEALQVLLAPTKPAPPRRVEPQVRISSPPLARVALPTPDEFQRLMHVVLDSYPVLKPRGDPADYAAQFRAAFRRLLFLGRKEKLDTDHGLSYWTDECREFLQRHQIACPVSIGGNAFTCAVIAQGDVPHTLGENYPFDLSFGLQWGGGGIEARDWWRRALAGTLLPPTPSPYPKPRSSPARVRQEI